MSNYLDLEDKEFDEFFEKAFKAMCSKRQDHEFKHFNVAMGIHIHDKEHYKREMKARHMLPYEQVEELAEQWDREHPHKEYKLSSKAEDIIRSLKLSSDKNGNIQLGGRALEALRGIGALNVNAHAHAPVGAMEGGFS